jgi:CubicO group peptidase (beta-lactamase class C family)
MPTLFIWILLLFVSSISYAGNVATDIQLDAIRAKYNLPALGAASYMVSSTNPIYTSKISGVRKWGHPAKAQGTDKFHLGSCTKAMTATQVAIYIEKGLLNWNTTLAQLFPELSVTMHPYFKTVTVAMLAAHRSGISIDITQVNGGTLWQTIRDPNLNAMKGRYLVAQTVLRLAPQTLPGTSFSYNNINYIILGAILEKISNQPWETLITNQLFIPLNMTSCGFGPAGNPDAFNPDSRSTMATSSYQW